MTVSTTTSRIQYNGNGIATAFAFPYKFIEDADLVVVLTDSSGTDTELTLSTHYTVSGAGTDSSGAVTMITAPASGEVLTIYRSILITQETDYISGDAFPAETHEAALDKLTLISQDLQTQVNRTIKIGETISGVTTTLPAPEAGKHIAWNSTATGLVNDDAPSQTIGAAYTDEIQVATAGQTVFTLTGLTYTPGVRNLSVYINGVRQYAGQSYTETDTTTVTFSSGLDASDEVLFVTADTVTNTVSSAASVQYQPAGTGAVATTVQAKLRESVSVKDFGAVGDGVTDDTAAIQSAIDSGARMVLFPSGIYSVSSTLTLSSSIIIQSDGAKIVSSISTGSPAISITASSVNIYGLEIQGIGNSSYIAANDLIKVSGTNNSPAAPTYVSDVIIRDCYLHGCGDSGIYGIYVSDSKFNNNRIRNVGRSGIKLLSPLRCSASDNNILNVAPGDGGGDAYGIYFSKMSTPFIEDPEPQNCACNNNVVANVPSWVGLDTHGGRNMTFSGNSIKDCKMGITFTKADDGAGTEIAAVQNSVIVGNTMIGTNELPGIVVTGLQSDGLYALNNTITGNSIYNYGDPANSNSGAINIDAAKVTSITGNSIIYPGACGVSIGAYTYSTTITGNSIKDPWSNTVTAPRYVRFGGNDANGAVNGNSFFRENTAYATYVGVRGVELNNTNTEIAAGINFNQATEKYVIASSGVFVGSPIVQSGTGSGTASTSSSFLDIPVTFPEAFTTIPNVTVSTDQTSGENNATNTVHVLNLTATSFTARISTASKAVFNNAHNFNIYWQASGY